MGVEYFYDYSTAVLTALNVLQPQQTTTIFFRILEHPCIVRFYTAFSNLEQKTYFVVMEVVEGDGDGFCDMERFCNPDCPLTIEEKEEISLKVWRGLAYLHTNNPRQNGETKRFIHRDMKPQNVLASLISAWFKRPSFRAG